MYKITYILIQTVSLKDRRSDQRPSEKRPSNPSRRQPDQHMLGEAKRSTQRLPEQLPGRTTSRTGLQTLQRHLPRAHEPIRVGRGSQCHRQVAPRRLLQLARRHDRPKSRAVSRRRSAHSRHQSRHAEASRVLRADDLLLCAR